MSAISITTTQNIELDYEPGSLGDRIVATIIDLVILAGYFIVIGMLLSFSGDFDSGISAAIYILLLLPVSFYTLLSETFMNGQTVGKRVMGIKVISLNGKQPSFGQYLIRWLFRLVDLWITSFAGATILVAATEKHQRLGDIIAGTAVVRTKPRTLMHQTLYMPVSDPNYVALYPEITRLTDSDMQLVKEVLVNVQKSGNRLLAYQTMEKIESVLGIKSRQEDPVSFLYTALSDYNHLTARAD